MTDHHHDEDWFMVYEGPFFDDESEDEPELTGVPAAFLARLRSMVPTWRSLGVTDEETVGCYEDDRLRVVVNISDSEAKSVVGSLRVEVSDNDWRGAWISPSLGIGEASMANASPQDMTAGPVTDEQAGVDEATGWLVAQLRRPIKRYVWRDGGRVVARSWRLDDSGRELVVSGAPQVRRDTSSAESTPVRG